MKILVTGGSGYLGNHVCKYFNAIDYSRRKGLDLLNEESLRNSLDGVDVVIHMAGATKGSNEELFRNNVDGTFNLLNIIASMKKKPVFLFSSSKEVYGINSDNLLDVSKTYSTDIIKCNFYGATKLLAEQLINSYALNYGFRAGIFRMSTVYAPYLKGTTPGLVSRFFNMVRDGEKICLKSNGRQIRDPLFISDLNELFNKFIKSDINFGVYDVGGGKENAISLLELVRLIESCCNKKANLVLDETETSDQMIYISNISRLEKELDWKPSVFIKQGIAKLI